MLVIVILLARRFITAILMMFDQHSDSISIAIFIRSIYYIIILLYYYYIHIYILYSILRRAASAVKTARVELNIAFSSTA